MQEVEAKAKKYEPFFPVTKIKKIIQENQEIGKLSNLVPPLIEKSLQFFLVDLIKKSQEVAADHGVAKLTPAVLKHALIGLDSYDFMKDALDDVDDTILPLASSKSRNSQKGPKRSKSQVQSKQAKQQKKGRKKNKISECQQSPLEAEEIEN